MVQVLNKTNMDHFSSSVEKPFSCAFEIVGHLYPLLSISCIRECMLRVCVSMMDDYRLCPMLIEHIAFDYYFFLGK